MLGISGDHLGRRGAFLGPSRRLLRPSCGHLGGFCEFRGQLGRLGPSDGRTETNVSILEQPKQTQ
eukprot:2619848-Pyramimonas_sp.AAC.1